VPNHIATELQDLNPPIGLSVDVSVEDCRFVLGDSPGLGVRVDEDAIALSSHLLPDPLAGGSHIRPERAGHRLHAVGADPGPESAVLNA
jgi:hypothetical protein